MGTYKKAVTLYFVNKVGVKVKGSHNYTSRTKILYEGTLSLGAHDSAVPILEVEDKEHHLRSQILVYEEKKKAC
jgi:hypothetical protein